MFFILEILPEWLWPLLLVAGIAGYVIGHFSYYLPPIRPHALIFKIVGCTIVAVCIFIMGMNYANQKWKQAAAELQTKIAVAEAKAGVVNTVIEEKLVTKVEVVKVQGDTVTKFIDREVVKYDSTCTIPPTLVDALNMSAKDPR